MSQLLPAVWIDTNIIIRYITGDHPVMTPETAQLMKKAESGQLCLKIPSLVIAECCWVLQSPHYHFRPSDIASALTYLITAKGVFLDEKDVLIEALELYGQTSVDFIDAYLAARAKASGADRIVTFNSKDFDKLNAAHCRPNEI